MFFCLCKVLFSDVLQFDGNFVNGHNNSKYRDCTPSSKQLYRSSLARCNQWMLLINVVVKFVTLAFSKMTYLFIIFIPQIIHLIGCKICLRKLTVTPLHLKPVKTNVLLHSILCNPFITRIIQYCWWHIVSVCFWFSPWSVNGTYGYQFQSSFFYIDKAENQTLHTCLSKPFSFTISNLIIFCFVYREKEMEDRKRKEKVSIKLCIVF